MYICENKNPWSAEENWNPLKSGLQELNLIPLKHSSLIHLPSPSTNFLQPLGSYHSMV